MPASVIKAVPTVSSEPPHVAEGLRRYDDIARQLEDLLAKLWAAPAAPRKAHKSIPQTPGVYLFTEARKPIYVGQTRKLRNRLRAHTIPSASQEQASFAFLLAKKQAEQRKVVVTGTRQFVARHLDFVPLFKDAKERVANMDVRFIEIPEPDVRTIFEVYASLALDTGEFNSFETH
jgi:hypothetical protein